MSCRVLAEPGYLKVAGIPAEETENWKIRRKMAEDVQSETARSRENRMHPGIVSGTSGIEKRNGAAGKRVCHSRREKPLRQSVTIPVL